MGSGLDSRGKLWRWEFTRWFGPLFVRKDGEPLAVQPVNDYAWDTFEAWYTKYKVMVGIEAYRHMWE
jgi:hypothetical protein